MIDGEGGLTGAGEVITVGEGRGVVVVGDLAFNSALRRSFSRCSNKRIRSLIMQLDSFDSFKESSRDAILAWDAIPERFNTSISRSAGVRGGVELFFLAALVLIFEAC